MKIGAEDKKKVIAMAVLLVIAVPLVIHSYSSFHTEASAPAIVPPAQPAGPAATRIVQRRPGVPKVRENTLDPTLNTNMLAASQKIEYTGTKRNIFKMFEPPIEIPKPMKDPRVTNAPPPPPPAPVIPQIPLKFYGFSNKPGEPKKAFLQNGPYIFVAVEGDIVDRRYKILKITNSAVLVEDVLNNNQQLISLSSPQS